MHRNYVKGSKKIKVVSEEQGFGKAKGDLGVITVNDKEG